MPWSSFLKRWSAEWIAAHDPETDAPLDDEVVQNSWLGFAPASPEAILAAEGRLGRPLPPSLRDFLVVTDGWRNAGVFVWRLAGADELAWLRDTPDAHWIDAYSGFDPDIGGDIIGRGLRISLEGDACVLFLDPDDVSADGEWAAYELASWSGMGPERHDSFRDLMESLYRGFHALRQPAGETRDVWDARVEEARIAALRGEVDPALATLREADQFGRPRARRLLFQLHAMLGDWYAVPLSHVSWTSDDFFAAEIAPLREASAPLAFGNPEFDAAVRAIRSRILADPAFQRHPVTLPESGGFSVVTTGPWPYPRGEPLPESALVSIKQQMAEQNYQQAEPERQARLDAAWPELLAAMSLWRPLSDDHLAPVVLFADPLFAQMLTPARGREILALPQL